LSENDDLLSQWRGYGGGNKSACIGFIKDDLINVKQNNKLHIRISKVIYDENEQKKNLIDFFK